MDDNSKTDFGKDLGKKDKPAEVSNDNLKTELTDEELSKVSGGGLAQACATGSHIKQGTITV